MHKLLAALLLGAGALVVAWGLFRLREARAARVTDATPARATHGLLWLLPPLLLMAGAAWVRLDDLGVRSLSHPEIYAPGIPLPPDISEPPPRIGLYETVSWHFHDEPHPQGYYLLMWGWTRLFGTGVAALRLPSVLFGVAAIWMIYLLASESYDRPTGWIAAGLLAFNGLHLSWSQTARMYALAVFLALASTLWLLRLLRAERHRGGESLYVVTTFLLLFTQMYGWLILGGQMLWTLLHRRRFPGDLTRVLQLQALAIMLGAPLWAHAIYRARPSPLDRASLEYVVQYLSFGMLLQPDLHADPVGRMPAWVVYLTLAVALVALVASLRRRVPADASPAAPLPVRRLLPPAAGMSAIVLALALIAYRRNLWMAGAALVPWIALALPELLRRLPVSAPGPARSARWPGAASPFVVLGLAPFALLFALSAVHPMLGPRLVLLFVPFLLVAYAAGLRRLFRRPVFAVALLLLLAVLHGVSVVRFRNMDVPRDYKGLGRAINARLQRGDLLFVPERSWIVTPLFYYLEAGPDALVARDFRERLQAGPVRRVWLVEYPGAPPAPEMLEALRDYRRVDEIAVHRGKALLYVTPDTRAPVSGG